MKSFRAKTWHASADAIYHLACEQALCFARRLISRDYAPVATHDRLLSRYLNFLLMITRARFQILDSLFWKMLDFIATFFWGVSKEKIATKAAFFRYYVSCYGRSMWGYICTKKRKLFFFSQSLITDVLKLIRVTLKSRKTGKGVSGKESVD